MSTDKRFLSYDMVYTPTGGESDNKAVSIEFRSIHVDGYIDDERFKIKIISDTDISEIDLETLINKIQSETLSKMRIDILDDCSLILSIAGDLCTMDIVKADDKHLSIRSCGRV